MNKYYKYLIRVEARRLAQLVQIPLLKLFNKNNKITKLKGIKTGKSCVIIGNGPSLNYDDLNVIQKYGIDTFGSNRIVDILGKTEWHPTYLCIADPTFLLKSHNNSAIDEYVKKANSYGIKKMFFSNILERFIDINKYNNIYFFNIVYAPFFSKLILPFNKDIQSWVSDLGGVTHFAIQLACYMGYSKIYLYGVDNTYTKYLDNDGNFAINNTINKSHADGMKTDEYDNISNIIPHNKSKAYSVGGVADKRKSDIGYGKCKKYAENNNIKIINLTRGGQLDIFTREKFENVFKNKEEKK